MAVQKEIWQKDIEEAFYGDIPFLAYATNVSDSVLGGKVVHKPIAGGLDAGITKNRSIFPATVKRRTDKEATYELAGFTTDPIHLPNAEQVELSYDKRKSLLDNTKNSLIETVSKNILHTWASGLTGANLLRTVSDEGVLATAKGATGNRKRLSEADFQTALVRIMEQTKGNAKDLVALVPYNLLIQLQQTSAAALTPTLAMLTDEERRKGFVGRIQNFLILPTHSRLYADTNGAVKAVEATGAATDNEVVLCWHKNAVEYALGSITMYEKENDPTYYGSVYSFEVRAGGTRRRSDAAGVLAIVPDTKTS